jgi:hypothetical protein
MPNLPMHIHLASRVAAHLGWDWLNDHVGSLYLGSTAPDIRAMTKWPRERTHFAPLSADQMGTGTRNMFRLHPELANQNGMSPATRAFLVGYISHLMADEAWISNIYRPHFDPSHRHRLAPGTEVEAHLWDRALQLDMDRRALHQMNGSLRNAETLADADSGVDVGFLDSESLKEWREWVCRFLGWEFSWDRLKRALNRIYRDDEEVQQTVDGFIQDMPHSLERVYEKIPLAKIDNYQQGALEHTLEHVVERWGQA